MHTTPLDEFLENQANENSILDEDIKELDEEEYNHEDKDDDLLTHLNKITGLSAIF